MNTDATTSRMTVRLVLDHVRGRAGEAGVADLLGRLGPEDAREVQSGRGPVTYELKERLFVAAGDVLADPRVGLGVGRDVLKSSVVAGLTPLIRAFASPEAVLENVAKVSTRFDTAAVLRCERSRPGMAELVWQVLPPHRAFRADCDYTVGLLSQTTVLFGLPPAAVAESQCQLDGAPDCRYVVTWRPGRPRWWRPGRDQSTVALDIANSELQLLQDAAGDLVAHSDVDGFIDRILDKGRSAVHAHGHVLAVRLGDGSLHTRALGLSEQGAAEIAAELLEGPVGSRPGLLTAEIQSASRRYGALAAIGLPGQEFFDADSRMLAAYARHLAAALDNAEAVQEARRQGETAQLLLALAHGLSEAHTVEAVAQTVAAAVPRIAGSDRAVVAVYSPEQEELRIAGSFGWPQALQERLDTFLATPRQAPELQQLLRTCEPLLVDATASAWGRGVLEHFEVRAFVAVPILTGRDLMGLVVAHWAESDPPAVLTDVFVERLSGLAKQTATALRNVQLLEQVRHQALHDSLTGLPNRSLFEERLDDALASARQSGQLVGVLFCDLNRFKRVNDSLGHAAGDDLLRQVAERLRSCIRGTDTAARFSGDEFVVLMTEVVTAEEVHALGARLEVALGAPFAIQGTQVFADSSVGVVTGDGTASREALLAAADQAMYAAKARVHGPGAALPRRDPESLALESDLHGAAGRGELLLHFQPQFDVARERVAGVESLVRWRHPVRGLVPPGAFIPLAEESGLIGEIGDWVLRESAAQAAGWRDLGLDLTVSVNVAVPQLHDDAFVERVRSVLAESGLAPSALLLEITESQVVADPLATRQKLQQLRDLGVGVSVDDFGTGYSSLSQLRRLPVTEVKIDRSFIAEIGDTPESTEFLAGLIGLARGLRLQVVAEGVETSEQLEALGRVGCDLAQGFLLARPLDAEALLEFLEFGVVAGSGL